MGPCGCESRRVGCGSGHGIGTGGSYQLVSIQSFSFLFAEYNVNKLLSPATYLLRSSLVFPVNSRTAQVADRGSASTSGVRG